MRSSPSTRWSTAERCCTPSSQPEAFTALPKIYRGTHLPHRNIVKLRASRVRVEADPPFPVEADGEHLGTTPAMFEVIPLPLRVKL